MRGSAFARKLARSVYTPYKMDSMNMDMSAAFWIGRPMMRSVVDAGVALGRRHYIDISACRINILILVSPITYLNEIRYFTDDVQH